MALRGSIELATTRLLTSSSRTTCEALAKAASVALASPMSLSQSNTMLPGTLSNSCGAPGAIASLAAVTAGSGSYSTSMASAAGSRQVFGNHQCHRLTDVTHLADCQHRPRRVMPRRAVTIDEWSDAGNVAEPIGANVVAGRYQQHARLVSRGDRIDALDLRMRQRRTQHSGMRHSRQSDVVGIAAASRNETQVLMAPYWLPDAKFHGCPHRYRVNGKPDLCSVNQSTSNTTWAALPSIRAPLHRQCPVVPKGDDHG